MKPEHRRVMKAVARLLKDEGHKRQGRTPPQIWAGVTCEGDPLVVMVDSVGAITTICDGCPEHFIDFEQFHENLTVNT